jgi:uncharacterized heparinase superfamily protein
VASRTPKGRSGRRSASWLEAASAAAGRLLREEWFASPLHRLAQARPRADGFAAFPKDLRPASPDRGRAVLRGEFVLAGQSMTVGPEGDPFNRASPSRPFAVELHGFVWLPHLLAVGEEGAREALRLIEAWRRGFGKWNSFAWGAEPLERRTYNLACAMGALTARASEAEVESLANLLARHARQLLACRDPVWRAAERAVVLGVVAGVLSGPAGERLLARTRRRIERLLAASVLPDGGHASRSPEAGLELLLDLLSLDDAFGHRGLDVPAEVSRAIDRLTAALRFFTLPDGRLACFQGGEEADPVRILAARVREETEAPEPPHHAPHAGYQRLIGPSIQVMVDAGAPAPDPWSACACAQTAAIEVVCGGDRLITNAGWSPRVAAGQALRLTDGASTTSIGHESAGEPVRGWRAKALGPRLVGGPSRVEAKRMAAPGSGVWLELEHDGWLARFGLMHARRLYVDLAKDELRGEDQFSPARTGGEARVVPYVAHFHLAPEVDAVVARDHRSVLLRGASGKGWWLRNDAVDVHVEPAVHYRDGQQIPTRQVVLMGHLRADRGGRVRWKLAPMEEGR